MQKNVNKLTTDSKKEAKDLFGISKAYWLYLNEYDVLERSEMIDKPLLVLQGESDYQVPMREFEALQNVLSNKSNVSS